MTDFDLPPAGPAAVEIPATPMALFAPAIGVMVAAALVLTVAAFQPTDVFLWLYGITLTGWAIYHSVRARRRMGQPALSMDRRGVLAANGQVEQAWAGLQLIWVVPVRSVESLWRVKPQVVLFSTAGVSFARRAQVPVQARWQTLVPTSWDAERVAGAIRACTDVRVVLSERSSLRRFSRHLVDPALDPDRLVS